MESFFSFWDYQEIEGIKIPFVQIRNVGLIGPPHGLVIKKVLINIPMENSMFVPLGEK